VLGMWEAWNRDDVASFGWHVEQILGVQEGDGGSESRDAEKGGGDEVAKLKAHVRKPWIWYSTDPKYFHEIGFLASFFQLIAASVFWISGSVPPLFSLFASSAIHLLVVEQGSRHYRLFKQL
jgi:hypothetical protein